jgi:hypothetical protein
VLLEEHDENGLPVLFPPWSVELALGVAGRPGLTELHFRSGKAVIIAAYPEAFRDRWRAALAPQQPETVTTRAHDAAEGWRAGMREAADVVRQEQRRTASPALREPLGHLIEALRGLAEDGP